MVTYPVAAEVFHVSSLGNETVKRRPPLSAMDFASFLQCDFPPRENLLAPWLPRGGLAMLYAPRGVGKTHVALGIAYAIASGGAVLKWQAKKPAKVSNH